MTAPLELFVLEWGIYPRRATIYLSEKGLLDSKYIKITPASVTAEGKLEAPGKPPGTMPILVLPDGQAITQSLAIIEYFEDIIENPQEAWQKELVASMPPEKTRSMRGKQNDHLERARVREMLAIADEVTSLSTFGLHKGSKLFEAMEPTSAEASRLAFAHCERNLGLLEQYYGGFEERMEKESGPNIVDCMFFSILQFMKVLYGKDLIAGRPNLVKFYETFKERDSARIPEGYYPEIVSVLAPQWL